MSTLTKQDFRNLINVIKKIKPDKMDQFLAIVNNLDTKQYSPEQIQRQFQDLQKDSPLQFTVNEQNSIRLLSKYFGKKTVDNFRQISKDYINFKGGANPFAQIAMQVAQQAAQQFVPQFSQTAQQFAPQVAQAFLAQDPRFKQAANTLVAAQQAANMFANSAQPYTQFLQGQPLPGMANLPQPQPQGPVYANPQMLPQVVGYPQ